MKTVLSKVNGEGPSVLNTLVAAGAAAPLRGSRDSMYLLANDLAALEHVQPVPSLDVESPAPQLPLGLQPDTRTNPSSFGLRLPGGATLMPGTEPPPRASALGPVLRAIIAGGLSGGSQRRTPLAETRLPGGWRLLGGTDGLHDTAAGLLAEGREMERVSGQDFANSASYLGGKRALLPFLMTSMQSLGEGAETFVDLMCGSGVVAGAASNTWRTIASDAQDFALVLAAVQGGGYSTKRAESVLDAISPVAKSNYRDLARRIADLIAAEEEFFRAAEDWSDLAPRYGAFVQGTPSFPTGGGTRDWNPVQEVRVRQQSQTPVFPYCMLTAYYANLFLGVRQAVELDSLRYAIDQVEDPWDRMWALGVLVVTTSAVATTYGGHFAQPPAPPDRLGEGALARKVLARRHRSVTREFEIRMKSLAAASETSKAQIELVGGPWRPALDEIAGLVNPAKTIVYVDAPYRREEYSRYYHLLESLVKYSYPEVGSEAKIPPKGPYRFASEFFTRSRSQMTQALVESIGTVLERGFRCAWSYSDHADAEAGEVLDLVSGDTSSIRSVTCRHLYKRQGRSQENHEGVLEYLFMLEPA